MTRQLLDGVEALTALARWGTVTEAARRLGLGQPAVSKRLRVLEAAVGAPLVVPDGRGVAITAEGHALLDRALPLLGALEGLARPAEGPARLTVVVEDALAGTWAPRALSDAARDVGELELATDAAPAGRIAELVRCGARDVGLVGGQAPGDLVSERIVFEPWARVHAGHRREPAGGPPYVPDGLDAPAGAERRVVPSVAAALALAEHGFGDALVPLGAAREADVPRRATQLLDVGREVHLLARRGTGSLPAVLALRDALRERSRRRTDPDRRR